MRLAFALAAGLLGCAETASDQREAEVASVVAQADQALIRSRPALVSGKYAHMSADLYSYHRGSLAVFRNDWRSGTSGISISRFSLDGPLVLGTGDPHFENYGTLLA